MDENPIDCIEWIVQKCIGNHFVLKMAERKWNWESKVEKLRKTLEKQALDRTFEVCDSADQSKDFASVDDISVINKKKLNLIFEFGKMTF